MYSIYYALCIISHCQLIILGYFKWSAQQISFARGLLQIGMCWVCRNEPNSHSPYLNGKKRLFFLKNTGDLHLLIHLIENWPWYAKNVDKFHAENLGSLTPATTRKLFTLAKFYRVPECRDSCNVLKNWIQLGDSSRFSRGHLEFAEIRELSELGRVEALKIYSSQPLRFFFNVHFIITSTVSRNLSAGARPFWHERKPSSCVVNDGPN
jgi:hypothetical protein